MNTAVNNRAYGFRAEAELLQYLRDKGLKAERLHLTGTEDEGDLAVGHKSYPDFMLIFQLKTYAPRSKDGSIRSLSHGAVKKWWKALRDQRGHYAAHRGLSELPGGILVVKPRGASWDDAMIIQRLGDWAGD